MPETCLPCRDGNRVVACFSRIFVWLARGIERNGLEKERVAFLGYKVLAQGVVSVRFSVWGLFSGLVLAGTACQSSLGLEHPFARPQQRSVHVSHFGAIGESTTEKFYLWVEEKSGSFYSTFHDRGRPRYFLPDGALSLSLRSEEGAPSFNWDLDPEGTDFWLILTRSYLGGGIRADLIRDDLEIHPVDHARLHNLSEFPLRGTVGDAAFEIEPGGDAVLSYDAASQSHLVFRVEWLRDDQWEEAYYSSRQLRPGRRINLLCQARPNSNIAAGASMMVHTIQQWVPTAEGQ